MVVENGVVMLFSVKTVFFFLNVINGKGGRMYLTRWGF